MSRWALGFSLLAALAASSGCGVSRTYAVRGRPYRPTPAYSPPVARITPPAAASDPFVAMPDEPPAPPSESPKPSGDQLVGEVRPEPELAPEPPATARELPPMPPEFGQASDEFFRISR